MNFRALRDALLPVAEALRDPTLTRHAAALVFFFFPSRCFSSSLLPPPTSLQLFRFSALLSISFHLSALQRAVWGSYLPPVAFKVFLGAKHPIHCHRNRKLSVEGKGEEKKKSGSLKLCNSVILPKSINGNTLRDKQNPAPGWISRRKGHPFQGHRFYTLV